MIPRFNYRYSLSQAWHDLRLLPSPATGLTGKLSRLFPGASLQLVSSARMGIYYALGSFGLKAGAGIGVQPYTCSSVLSAIVAAGYRPVFIDINDELTLDLDDLQRNLANLDALIVTHTFGMVADVRAIRQVAGHLPIIEDCAHAFLGQCEGDVLGSFFDIAVFSFGNGKFPSLGGGGLLVINQLQYAPYIADRLHDLKSPGLISNLVRMGKRLINARLHSRLGEQMLYRLLSDRLTGQRSARITTLPSCDKGPGPTLNANLNQQLKHLDTMVGQQQRNARYIMDRQGGHYKMLGHTFAVVLLTDKRNQLYHFLRQRGVGAGKHFQHALSLAMPFGYRPGTCPHFERLVEQVLTVPCHYSLTTQDLQRIDHALKQYTTYQTSVHEETAHRY
ncbi:hypothetical protein GCM10027085_49330 [Spirosoma aerophilum]